MRVYRCLIVDDEDLILQRLEKFFASYGSKYELIGKAYSGQEAIDIASEENPDIVLTDIVMPGMDGIEMIEQMKRKHPNTIFIILTAYSDFEYAKRAIKQNVLEYMIKVPLSSSDVLTALDKASNDITLMEMKEEQLVKLQRSRLEHLHRLRKQVFNELLRGEINAGQIEQLSEELKVERKLEAYNCFLLEFCDYAQFKTAYPAKDQSVLKYAALNIIEETIGNYAKGFSCEISENYILGIVTWTSVSSQSQMEWNAQELGQTIIGNMKSFLKQNCNISFSKTDIGWYTLGDSYRQAREKLADTYYLEDGALLGPSYRTTRDVSHYDRIQEEFRKIVKQLQPNVAPRLLNGNFERIALLANQSKVERERMEKWIRSFLQEVETQVSSWKNGLLGSPMEQLQGLKFTDQLEICSAYVTDSIQYQAASYRPEIVKAKQYIEDYISQKLSLDEIADYTNLTPPYFSSLFKRETGENLIDYINRRKMEKALELLKEKDYTNASLSEALGIFNEKYFCTLFKQHYGHTPQKFRKQFFRN
ncbi:response regulator [Paenibacillus alba]|uniref:Response regulator n=1 Tax=Paenibacillus alba TaxID=1197127 RepID=A0ABU6G442_9BACL|nr:response regulator [Paenibacillus alba]MEC0228706.1 response regulator [Paenibacillus alba]